jgi:hypothetical protein
LYKIIQSKLDVRFLHYTRSFTIAESIGSVQNDKVLAHFLIRCGFHICQHKKYWIWPIYVIMSAFQGLHLEWTCKGTLYILMEEHLSHQNQSRGMAAELPSLPWTFQHYSDVHSPTCFETFWRILEDRKFSSL